MVSSDGRKSRKALSRYLVIHGHFYQPPRENPWTEVIERQDSAAPYHDWNERVARECYTPNAHSRILDSSGRIQNIVNNYRWISFNIGPTLMAWLEDKAPRTYHKILEADAESCRRLDGHGNAIAQAYNHMILPLANERDKVTQVRWGIADFQHRFGRAPESMWLPETAVNYPTLDVLWQHGIKFIILSPYQAKRVRPLKGGPHWDDVSEGDVDTSQPYRCFLRDAKGKAIRNRYVDVFFYHGSLSRGVGFEHYLQSAPGFADRIAAAFRDDREGEQLVSIGTDGESYGHHEPFGDMGLASLIEREAPKRNMEITNYAYFLSSHTPVLEVEIKMGPHGEGTSWSCAHGVGRWYRDCGCARDGGWNQKWRRPMREAMDFLRDELARKFEAGGSKIFHDPWAARDDYIQVILDRSPETLDEFFAEHTTGELTPEKRLKGMLSLEAQRNAMLMYTSCGWFFADISGIEGVQVLRYAARAIELGERLYGANLEKPFLDVLGRAESNIPAFRDGAFVYHAFVKPSQISFEKVVNHFAIRSLFKERDADRPIYHFEVMPQDRSVKVLEKGVVNCGCVEVRSGITQEEGTFAYALRYSGMQELHTLVHPCGDRTNYESFKKYVLEVWTEERRPSVGSLRRVWEGNEYSLADMFFDERREIIDHLMQDRLAQLAQAYSRIFDQSLGLIRALRKYDIPLPQEFEVPAKYTLSNRLQAEISRLRNVTSSREYEDARQIVETAEGLGLDLNKEEPSLIFQEMLRSRVQRLRQQIDIRTIDEIQHLHKVGRQLGLELVEGELQPQVFETLETAWPGLVEKIQAGDNDGEYYQIANGLMRLAYRLNINTARYKQQIKALEDGLSEKPEYWP